MDTRHDLYPIFNPAAVAVVGASEVPGKAAERRTRSLIEGSYPGRIYLINPKRDRLFGLDAYSSLTDVEGPLDLVMIVIPGKLIPRAVQDAAEKGAKGVVIITAGFGETGSEGKKTEDQIMAIANRYGIQVIGPNCSGMYSASGQINLLGIPMIQPGYLSVLAQSGNIIDSLTHYARRRGRGFSRIISSGNAIGVPFHQYVDFLMEDHQTRVILLYLESIKQGDALIQVCRKATHIKPTIALKVGNTNAGRRASASHTGALAADDRIVDAAFEQAGIIRVTNIDEMFDLAEAFLDCPIPKGNRVAILSEGGGDNAVAADNADRHGLEVPVLTADTQNRIRPYLLAGMPAHNPVDYGGTAEEKPSVIAACVEAVMDADDVDMVYLTGFFGGFRDIIAPHVGPLETETSRKLVELVSRFKKPLVVHTSFAMEDYEAVNVLRQGGIPVHISSERAAQSLSSLACQYTNTIRSEEVRPVKSDKNRRRKLLKIAEVARKQGRRNLLETESLEILRLYGLHLPSTAFADSPAEAVLEARRLGFPVAIKVVSPDILHKSDVGGVKLNLTSATAVKDAARDILRLVGVASPMSRIEGFLVTPMAPPGLECIFGIFQDPGFGPVVMFGLGGIFVEVLKDVTFGVAPLSSGDVERMIHAIRGYPLLKGFRGQSETDIGAIHHLIECLSLIAVENPDLADVDLNPVIVHADGISVMDARIILTH
ncbi:MAG: acetate--CoA ligase family protein [Desulfatirhabdiaceae bacterium]